MSGIKIIVSIVFLVSLLIVNFAYADQIPTTLSATVGKIVFDGKWGNEFEWKGTTLTETKYDDGNKVVIRIGHDYENIYFLIDFLTDTSIQNFKDKAIVCIDNNTEQELKPNAKTYCFQTTMGSKKSFVLQGDSKLASTGFYKTIENHPDFIAVGNISDENDRHSKRPHASYEFKIPIEIFGRSNVYGFFVSVTDGKTGQQYNWPSTTVSEKYPFIPPPNTWGKIISPDKSIPEFSIPLYILVSTLVGVILISKLKLQNVLIKIK